VDAGAGDAASRCIGYSSPPTDGGLSGGLLVHYSCEQTSGPQLIDQSGNSRHGILAAGGAGGAAGGYTFIDRKPGNKALALNVGSKGYVKLPDNLLADSCEATIATWVYVNLNSPNWQRIWDFGKDTNVYMFLSTSNLNSKLRFGISIAGYRNESGLETDLLPEKTWKHVAVVLGASGAIFYVDGQEKARNPAVVLRPADLGVLPNDYIGRSQFSEAPYNDPYLDGAIDEFRVYDRALAPQEIQALFTGS